MLVSRTVFTIILLHVAVLAFQLALPLQQRPLSMQIFFFLKGVAVDFGEEVKSFKVGDKGLVFDVCIKAYEFHELCLQFVEDAEGDSTDVGIERVLIEEVIQILGGNYVGGK